MSRNSLPECQGTFEKVTKNGGTESFHKFVYDRVLYLDPNKLLPAFFHNQASIEEAIFGRVPKNIKFS